MPAVASAAALGVQAFYILFANQIDSPTWPDKVCQNSGHGPQGSECVDARQYKDGVFIASPQNMTAAHIAKIKRDVPGAKVVGYWDFGGMPLYANPDVCPFCTGHVMGDKPGRNCSTSSSQWFSWPLVRFALEVCTVLEADPGSCPLEQAPPTSAGEGPSLTR